MNRDEVWKNFDLGQEVAVAGASIYNGLRRFHEMQTLNHTDEVFEFLYGLAVGIERRTFCAGKKLDVTKPVPGLPPTLQTIGNHLLKRRVDLRLTRKAAAEQMGLHPTTLKNWEKNRTQIEVRFYPALIGFLGYNPLPEARTRGEAVRRQRLTLGLSLARLAKMARV